MSIANLKLDESTKLEFGVSITGASGLPMSRLVIEGKKYSISYPCVQTTAGVEVLISELKNIIPAGTYPVRLEVIIENKIYVPFEDTIVFEPAIAVESNNKLKQVQVKEAILVNNIVVTPDTSKDKMKVALAIAETVGYKPAEDESAQSIFENSLMSVDTLDKITLQLLPAMLKLAEEVGISTK